MKLHLENGNLQQYITYIWHYKNFTLQKPGLSVLPAYTLYFSKSPIFLIFENGVDLLDSSILEVKKIPSGN